MAICSLTSVNNLTVKRSTYKANLVTILCCWEGYSAVQVVRDMAGATKASKAVPGTIRGDYSVSAQENIVHTSDSLENAEIELKRFFVESDYCDYSSPLDPFKYAPDEY
jgi:nucleoside-diphosphate kinase